MKKAFYIRTRKPVNEDKGCIGIDKIGGLPTHKPPYFPTYASGKQEGFLMQIYCDKEKFPDFQNILCWQFYQDVNEEDMITIVEVPIGAELNVNNEGTIIERIKERIIYYEEGLEPDIWEIGADKYSEEEEDLFYSSKIGGAVPDNYIDSELEYIGRIYESICDDYELNFGTAVLELCRDKNGKLIFEE
ncbi:hypothetical protein [Clostridium beijerinckii]|uniref:hypothetical protein n=1 Tax=Clostridium beijerinckii TaxID=1520 RepID=UPI00098BDFA3|nr:hypothetical protein [Clostridium beijerinckii]MBA8932922.1 hypothetical protein [Clostridium beijerinckii]NOW06106.1 hypothetical protein [Clostridium beijerinckii]NRU37125.1 hypothetical protein [Clostridium beijerinckii]NSA99596.1 hypothetical protein [Clostridium beijerinckii]NYC00750.1 hypothetical protein [Clostridium beijerinckii]